MSEHSGDDDHVVMLDWSHPPPLLPVSDPRVITASCDRPGETSGPDIKTPSSEIPAMMLTGTVLEAPQALVS